MKPQHARKAALLMDALDDWNGFAEVLAKPPEPQGVGYTQRLVHLSISDTDHDPHAGGSGIAGLFIDFDVMRKLVPTFVCAIKDELRLIGVELEPGL